MAAAASNNTPAIIRRFLVLPNRMPPNFPHGTFSDAVSVGKEAIGKKKPGLGVFFAWLRTLVRRKMTMLRSSRADLAIFRGYYAFVTSMRLPGCAGRSYPSHSTSRIPAIWWKRGSLPKYVASRDIKLACIACRYGSAVCAGSSRQIPAYSDGNRAVLHGPDAPT